MLRRFLEELENLDVLRIEHRIKTFPALSKLVTVSINVDWMLGLHDWYVEERQINAL